MIEWPDDIRPLSGGYAPLIRSLSGGASISGFEQVQPQFSDRWCASFTFKIKTQAHKLELRSVLTRLRGRTGTVGLPAFDRVRAPRAADTPAAPVYTSVASPPFYQRWPAVAGTQHEFTSLSAVTGTATLRGIDHFSFNATGLPPQEGMYVTLLGERREITGVTGPNPYTCYFRPVGPAVNMTAATQGGITSALNASAAVNATSLDIRMTVGVAPTPGHLFSVGNRLYAINDVSLIGSSVYRVGIWPWLREAVTNGAAVNFTDPLCEMRLASDGEGVEALRNLSQMRFDNIQLSFEEASAA